MMVKVLLFPLFFLLTSLTGVYPQEPKVIYVKEGEMVALQCCKWYKHGGGEIVWTSNSSQETDLTKVSSEKQRQMGVLVHGRSLVILNASIHHQGKYSGSLRDSSNQFWFRLMVNTTKSTYPMTCHTKESCTLKCPNENTPAPDTPDITTNSIIWHKEGESSPMAGYFSSAKKDDSAVYTCTRSYLYHGQLYNMTFTVVLDVQPKKKTEKYSEITSPDMGQVFPVDLGSLKVIDCKADLYSDFDEIFWLSGDSLVERNSNLSVFYNYTREKKKDMITMTASLVFKQVSEEDLSKNYTCKLDSEHQLYNFVTIRLAQKPRPSYASLTCGVVSSVVVMVLIAVIYVKFKIDITLFLRDILGCYNSTSDGKSYDAFLMYYKSDSEAGLNENDRNWLKSDLEDRLGYSLCLYDRDILPGEAVAEAVLDSVERSRTVVLVPTSQDPGPESGLLSVIHEALVERQTRLVFIKTEATEVSRSGSLPEALQLLAEAGKCVTWKGKRSKPSSSPFWKKLRYHLPAPQHAPKTRLSPKTI